MFLLKDWNRGERGGQEGVGVRQKNKNERKDNKRGNETAEMN